MYRLFKKNRASLAEYIESLLGDYADGPALYEAIMDAVESDEEFDLPAAAFAIRMEWPVLIKLLRALHGGSIADAQFRALDHEGWRRWCRRRIETDRRCARQAFFAAKEGRLPGRVVIQDGKAVIL